MFAFCVQKQNAEQTQRKTALYKPILCGIQNPLFLNPFFTDFLTLVFFVAGSRSQGVFETSVCIL